MVLYIGIPLAILLFVLLYFLRKRANASYSTGRRIANTDLVRNSDIYKKKERTFKTLFILSSAENKPGSSASIFIATGTQCFCAS